ncbi:STAS domain-containing protein [Bacillus sp. FJAT-42376]|uniref:STAS domain-containing protein n=1 Tax=Bacillus sp. FJAT-42376 TaxID=2014076 RepID=UPI000F4DFE93|nr:STAS domain-containing protein [Bacillus sp. FJAT-42376]AZB41599.1 STAS domain-containing protein [Bacillus sp. FJAT-42376]
METKAKALYQYLVETAPQFTEEWYNHQSIKPGSDYSLDAPPQVSQKIKDQNTNYVRLVAKSLDQSEEDMKKGIAAWTKRTAADRAQSRTSISEVTRNFGVFRRVFWQFVERFASQTDLPITIQDLFYWERKLNSALDYVIESFTSEFMKIMITRLEAQSSLIMELSAPVIELTKDIGLLPIIGDIDTARAKNIMESSLQQSIELGINYLILDLSGVVTVDTMVAKEIFQLVEALKLIGVETIICGIRPEVAQTAIQLGVDFSGIKTESTLQKAVRKLARDL